MKYVRTNFGKIFDENAWKAEVEYIKRYYPTTDIDSLIHSKGDTIKELCDVFIILYDGNKVSTYDVFEDALLVYKREEYASALLGGIVTDKEITFAAKYEKGELELL